jgi:hypothetical protein
MPRASGTSMGGVKERKGNGRGDGGRAGVKQQAFDFELIRLNKGSILAAIKTLICLGP